jgi:hypothetical protein
VLTVVEQDQQRTRPELLEECVADRPPRLFLDAHAGGNDTRDKYRITQWGQFHQPNAIGEPDPVEHVSSNRQGQTSLAAAAGPR